MLDRKGGGCPDKGQQGWGSGFPAVGQGAPVLAEWGLL